MTMVSRCDALTTDRKRPRPSSFSLFVSLTRKMSSPLPYRIVGYALVASAAVVLVKYYVDASLRSGGGRDDIPSIDPPLILEGEVVATFANSSDPFDVPFRNVVCNQSCADGTNATDLVDPNAPLAIIGGAMKGGTRALLTYLGEHPQVFADQGNEVHLFDERHYEHIFPEDKDGAAAIDRCLVLQTYRDTFDERRGQQQKTRPSENTFFDKTPSYMEYSHYIPQRILCALFVLRNPVDRTYSHFQHCNKKHKDVEGCKGKNFEESIDTDMAALERAGVLDASLTPAEEYDAWVRYHNLHGKLKGNLMICKSLYAIQLRQWIAIFMRHFGREDFLKHLLIMESEWMHDHKQAAYNQTLDFVGLPRHVLDDDDDFHVGHYEPMRQETREQLEDFFRPFNKRLNQLLSPFGIEISWARDGQ